MGIRACQHEQVGDHPRHTVGFDSHALQRAGLEFRIRCSDLPHQIEGGEHDRQGCAQFVRHVDQKLTLEIVGFLDLLIGILQRLQHAVDRPFQAANFIGAFARSEAKGVILRDRYPSSRGRQELQRTHRLAHQQPDRQRRQPQCHDDPRIEEAI